MAEQGPMSGFRDLLAEQMIPRQEMLDTVRRVYENYGFVPLKTPALERLDTLTGRYGDEGEKLMYKFKDNGGRDVAMRYDQTVPLARVVAQYGSQLPTPYKRYALGEVWRGESPQAGRYREFTQFDADTVGTSSYLADAEVIAMMRDSMGALGLETQVRVNDRRILDGLAAEIGISDERDFRALVGIIDKIDKVGKDAILTEVEDTFGSSASETVKSYLSVEGSTDEKLSALDALLPNDAANEGIESVGKIMGALSLAGYNSPAVVFDPTIARGLDYYTSTVYETTLVGAEDIGSVCSGGRYDNLIEAMGGPSTPAVGTSIGVDRLLEGMRLLGKLAEPKTTTDVFVANMDPSLDAQRFALVQDMRRAGIATDLVFEEGRLGKQFKRIDRLGVNKVVIMGQDEVDAGIVQVKDLASGEQVSVKVSDLTQQLGQE